MKRLKKHLRQGFDTVLYEINKYSVLIAILLTVPYAAWVLSLTLSSWLTLLLLGLNPLTIRTLILFYVKREALINAYYLFEGYFIAKKADDEDKRSD